MDLWTGILTILGCAVAGLVLGIIIFYILRRIRKKKEGLIRLKDSATYNKSPKSPITTQRDDKVINSNIPKETPEILISSYADNTMLKSRGQSASAEINKVQESIKQNVSIVGKSEEPERTGAIHWTELFKQNGALSSTENQESVEYIVAQNTPSANQKDSLVVDELNKSATQNLSTSAEIIKQRIIPEEKRHRESTRPITANTTDTTKTSATAEDDSRKEALKPVTPLEPVLANPKNAPTTDEYVKATDPNIPIKSMSQNQENTPIPEKLEETSTSDFIKELKTNLVIATTPWADKLLSFQTGCWNTTHGEGEPLLIAHHQDLIQLYVDIGLANNIVWLATEMGHRSKELDDSYIKLCANIAEKIKMLMSLADKSS